MFQQDLNHIPSFSVRIMNKHVIYKYILVGILASLDKYLTQKSLFLLLKHFAGINSNTNENVIKKR